MASGKPKRSTLEEPAARRPVCAWHNAVELRACPYFAVAGSSYCAAHGLALAQLLRETNPTTRKDAVR